MIDRAFANQFAENWVAAWNSHDLDRILSLYADDFSMQSPLIATIANEPSGRLVGKPAVAEYWGAALKGLPDLQFQLIDVLLGADSIALYYQGHSGPVVEVFTFDHDGRVTTGSAHYA